MAITWANIVAIAPSLSTVPSASQTILMSMAAAQMDSTLWGDLYDAGQTYLTAHLAQLGILGGSGPVTQETVGDLSVSYASPKLLGSSMFLTSYGVEYERLSRLLSGVLGMVP